MKKTMKNKMTSKTAVAALAVIVSMLSIPLSTRADDPQGDDILVTQDSKGGEAESPNHWAIGTLDYGSMLQQACMRPAIPTEKEILAICEQNCGRFNQACIMACPTVTGAFLTYLQSDPRCRRSYNSYGGSHGTSDDIPPPEEK